MFLSSPWTGALCLAYVSDTSVHQKISVKSEWAAAGQFENMWEFISSYLRNSQILIATDLNSSQPDSD